ncbi:hypothetical protein F1609_20915 [Massilia sp. CCM 8693]|uniref:Uncharacterized protein n=1 Tax=Massilia aquatica TaxID=2609000 RepID=A0ABX0M611_9BURK|nr:hypothetical protein [Massilia aquatica]
MSWVTTDRFWHRGGGEHPASLVNQLTPRIWKKMFPANPLRLDLHELGGRRNCAAAWSLTC